MHWKDDQGWEARFLEINAQDTITSRFMNLILEKNIIAIRQIQYVQKTYELNFSLRCQLEEDDGCISITSEMLDIIGTGKTESEAYQSFCQEFDLYNFL